MLRSRFALAAAALVIPFSAQASFHIIHINEVYTNGDGTLQFIELQADADGQTQLQLAELVAQNADGTVLTTILDVTTAFPALNDGETVLFATSAAQSALGFPADYTIPASSIPLTNGRVRWQQDGAVTIPDAVAYGAFTGSNTGHGTPAPALPTDGSQSLTRTSITGNNSTEYSVQTNSPTNNAGQTGTLGATAASDWDLYE